MPVIVTNGSRVGSTYALIDTGANVCAVSEKLVEELNLGTEELLLSLGTFDSCKKVVNKPITSFMIENLDRTLQLPVDNALVSALLTTESESIMTNEKVKLYDHMRDISVTELDDKSVGIILSSRYARYIFGTEKRDHGSHLAVHLL